MEPSGGLHRNAWATASRAEAVVSGAAPVPPVAKPPALTGGADSLTAGPAPGITPRRAGGGTASSPRPEPVRFRRAPEACVRARRYLLPNSGQGVGESARRRRLGPQECGPVALGAAARLVPAVAEPVDSPADLFAPKAHGRNPALVRVPGPPCASSYAGQPARGRRGAGARRRRQWLEGWPDIWQRRRGRWVGFVRYAKAPAENRLNWFRQSDIRRL
jgi:hypothetical protein